MTEILTQALPELRFRLPGQWWQVPLHDKDEARASVRRLVERQVGKADNGAKVRDDLRKQFLAALEFAIEGDGQALHLALDVIEDVPLSASVTVFLPPIGMTPAIGTASSSVMAVLEQGLALTAGNALDTAVRFDIAESTVLRTHKVQVLRVTDIDGSIDDLPTVVAEYWLTIPGTKRVILLVFTTVFAELEEVMLEFFDSIVQVAYWRHPGTVSE
ncbi:MAG: hypothetical protein ABJA94_04330 [Rhodoglobus sp.]